MKKTANGTLSEAALESFGNQRKLPAKQPMKAKTLIIFGLIAIFSFQSYGKGNGKNAVVFDAAAQGDVVRLMEYFAADTNLVSLLNSLLRTAALNGQKDTVEFLIALDADVNDKDFFDMAPLAHMAMYGTTNDEKCAEIATVLIAHGAEVDPVDQYGATPLLHAVESKKIKLTRVLLEHGANPAKTYGKTYFTPLHYAMRSSDTEMIKLLLDFKAPVEIVDPDRTTPLMRAVASKNHAVARLLLEHGAKIAAPRNEPGLGKQSEKYWSIQNDNMEKTPMLRAITFRDTEMVALLLEFKAPVNAIDQDGKTPLHWAAQTGNTEMAKLLLDAKAKPDVIDDGGATPLSWAEASDNKEIIQLLRHAAPSNPEASVSAAASPTREAMRALARRISDGDAAAFDELVSIAETLYRGFDPRNGARVQLGYSRMKAVFDPLGEEAGKGNDKAFQALKKSLGNRILNSFAPDALGLAAAAGHKEALDILLHYKQWDIVESSAGWALVAPAKANQQPAVDFFAKLLLAPPPNSHWDVSGTAKEGLEGAAAKGNEKAKQALEKFAAANGEPSN